MKRLIAWGIAAAVSGGAAAMVVHHGTPIDRALPAIVIIVTALAALSRPELQLAVPLLIGGEIALADERLRLTWFGLVLAFAFAYVVMTAPKWCAPFEAIAAIVLLRWIPLSEVLVWRELLLIAIAVGIVFVYRSTPLAVAMAIAVALFTPAIPLRTFSFPLAVLIAGLLLRAAGMPEVRAALLSAAIVGVVMTFFAWSGAIARSLPIVLRGVPPHPVRRPVAVAVGPGQVSTLDVPDGATSLILSGANIPRLRRGALLGYVDPGRREIRVGDVADWGSFRREQIYNARNPWPRDPAGAIRGYGQTAWVDGGGRVPLPTGARVISVSGAPTLPFGSHLQIDAFELRTP